MIPATATETRSAAAGPPVRRCGPLSVLVAALLPAAGSLAVDSWPVGALALAVQLVLMQKLLADPRGKAPWYNGTGTTLYVLGMLVTAFALRPVMP